ncbi:unnamed protein product [Notodromas monacha]|uniref:Sugar phosphate phosphatase n=1 Tax=Notodromas monacha TaxID=399045 RepID=A0A7R9BS19_9CRUS|nr:unnamed protein product [Notodromas monacha]CAG0920301.1 unnamed protein product [Notodromas monacha]
MLKAEDAFPLPEPLSARHKDSFAYTTMKDRQPVILTKVIDYLFRERKEIAEVYGDDVLEDLKAINELLAQLRYELMTDKPLSPLNESELPDVHDWNHSLEEARFDCAAKHEDCSWFTAPWLLVECYLYRRIKDAFLKGSGTGKLKHFDFFADQKKSSLLDSLSSVRILGNFLLDKLSHLQPGNPDASKTLFFHMVELSLWGNKCDLCISGGNPNAHTSDPLADLDVFRQNILSDHLDDIWSFVKSSMSLGPAEICFIADNAGFELFSDLALADFCVSIGFASKVVFHVKSFPWFVSDTVESDVEFLLKVLEEEGLCSLALRWKSYFETERWSIESDHFWTLSEPFPNMKKIRPLLYERLSRFRLLVVKGDLNYRKLLSDLNWEHHTSFELALRQFHPCALVTLRTMKSDMVAGLRPSVGKNAHTIDPNWMITGKYGLVQFSGRKDTESKCSV